MFFQVAEVTQTTRYFSTFWANLSAIKQEQQHEGAPKSIARHNVEKILPNIIKLAQDGNSQAQYYLAKYLQLQDNHQAAETWLEKSAALNYADACFELASTALEDGQYLKAQKYFMKLDNTGDLFLIDSAKTLLVGHPALSEMPLLAQKQDVTNQQDNSVEIFIANMKQGQTLFSNTGSCHESVAPTMIASC